MSTKREQTDRQAHVAQLTASGCTPTEVARILGIYRSTVYRDLVKVRERALDRVMMDEDAEAEAIQAELDELDSLFRRGRRVLEERTEPGTREYAAVLKSVTELKRLRLHVCAELGIYRKAVQRHLVLPGDELASLHGEALEKYVTDLDEAVKRLARVGRRGGKTSS